MADTTFTAGTVIESSWLNDVNTTTYKSFFNVKTYGALGDGSTDDTAAIAAAIAAAADGNTVYFPAGIYKVSSAISIADPVVLTGDFHNSIIKTTSATADIFTVNSNCVRINSLSFDSSVVRTINCNYIHIAGTVQVFITECEFLNWSGAIKSSGTSVTISGCQFYNGIASIGVGIQIDNGFDVSIKDMIMSNPAQVFAGIYITQTGDVSIDDCQIILGGQGLYLNPGAGQVITSVWANNCFFDTCSRGLFATALAAGSSIVRCLFDQCWFASASSSGVHLGTGGVGAISGMDFNGCQFVYNTGNGITLNDSGVAEVHIRGCDIAGNGGSGVGVAANVNKFSVTNSRVGDSHGFVGNAYGVFIAAGTTENCVITNNQLTGNTTASLVDDGTGINRVIHSNTGWGVGRATYDPGSLLDGAGVTTTVACPGAQLGDIVDFSFSLDTQGIAMSGYVYAADSVAVRFQNETTGTIDLGSGLLRVSVRRYT
jgi:hypothetical protein